VGAAGVAHTTSAQDVLSALATTPEEWEALRSNTSKMAEMPAKMLALEKVGWGCDGCVALWASLTLKGHLPCLAG
jgi:hypothetical protein